MRQSNAWRQDSGLGTGGSADGEAVGEAGMLVRVCESI